MEKGELREKWERAQGEYRQRVVSDGWVPWLGALRMTTFSTQTFESSVHPEKGDRVFRRFVRGLCTRLPRAVYGVRATERTARGWIHFHLVLRGLMPDERVSRSEILELRELARSMWSEAGGGFSQWKPLTAGRLAYAVKYVAKGGEVDPFGVWPEWGRVRVEETGGLVLRVSDVLDYGSRLGVCEGCSV